MRGCNYLIYGSNDCVISKREYRESVLPSFFREDGEVDIRTLNKKCVAGTHPLEATKGHELGRDL